MLVRVKCDDCGAEYSLQETVITVRDMVICDTCYDNHYFMCEHCGDIDLRSECVDYESELLCGSCYDETVQV